MSTGTATFEENVWDLLRNGIAVELLIPGVRETGSNVGVRLRTFGKDLPKDRMILATGDTFAEALEQALDKAENKRWEHLSWSKRPWPLTGPSGRDTAGAYGLL